MPPRYAARTGASTSRARCPDPETAGTSVHRHWGPGATEPSRSLADREKARGDKLDHELGRGREDGVAAVDDGKAVVDPGAHGAPAELWGHPVAEEVQDAERHHGVGLPAGCNLDGRLHVFHLDARVCKVWPADSTTVASAARVGSLAQLAQASASGARASRVAVTGVATRSGCALT